MNEYNRLIEELERLADELRMKANEIELTLMSVKKAHMTFEDRRALAHIAKHNESKAEFENKGLDRREKKAWKRLMKTLKKTRV